MFFLAIAAVLCCFSEWKSSVQQKLHQWRNRNGGTDTDINDWEEFGVSMREGTSGVCRPHPDIKFRTFGYPAAKISMQIDNIMAPLWLTPSILSTSLRSWVVVRLLLCSDTICRCSLAERKQFLNRTAQNKVWAFIWYLVADEVFERLLGRVSSTDLFYSA